jgi:hypothetical protein
MRWKGVREAIVSSCKEGLAMASSEGGWVDWLQCCGQEQSWAS